MTVKSWGRVSEGAATDHTVLKVKELQVSHPLDGSVHRRVVIDAGDWVNVIPVTTEGKVVLIRQFRFGTWSTTLEIPGGMVEPNEAPGTAAARELEEETGYRPAELLPLGTCHPNPAIQNNRTFSFLALGCKKVHEGKQDVGEDIAVELVERSQIDGLIRQGAITHALVLVAFLFERMRA